MDKSEFYKEIMDKLMGMPYEDEEMEKLGKKKPGASVVKIEVMGEKEDESMEGHEDAEMDKALIDQEIKKKMSMAALAK